MVEPVDRDSLPNLFASLQATPELPCRHKLRITTALLNLNSLESNVLEFTR